MSLDEKLGSNDINEFRFYNPYGAGEVKLSFVVREIHDAISCFNRKINELISANISPQKVSKISFFVKIVVELFKSAIDYACKTGIAFDDIYKLIDKKAVGTLWHLIATGRVKFEAGATLYNKMIEFRNSFSDRMLSKYYQRAQNYREILSKEIFNLYESVDCLEF